MFALTSAMAEPPVVVPATVPVGAVVPAAVDASAALAEQLAAKVKIYRDEYGTPHVDGETDASVVFGFAYAQAEDYFWQIEDSYILQLGRYSRSARVARPELRPAQSGLRNRAAAQAAFAELDAEHASAVRGVCRRSESLPGDASRSQAATDPAFRALARVGVRAAHDAGALLSLHTVCRAAFCRGRMT